MKGLDTPILLGILHGSASSSTLLRSLRGEELGTTELNFLELGLIAERDARSARAARLASLEKLRRRLTVLPLTSGGVTAAARLQERGVLGSTIELAIWGVIEAAGCSEWITSSDFRPNRRTHIKVRIVTP